MPELSPIIRVLLCLLLALMLSVCVLCCSLSLAFMTSWKSTYVTICRWEMHIDAMSEWRRKQSHFCGRGHKSTTEQNLTRVVVWDKLRFAITHITGCWDLVGKRRRDKWRRFSITLSLALFSLLWSCPCMYYFLFFPSRINAHLHRRKSNRLERAKEMVDGYINSKLYSIDIHNILFLLGINTRFLFLLDSSSSTTITILSFLLTLNQWCVVVSLITRYQKWSLFIQLRVSIESGLSRIVLYNSTQSFRTWKFTCKKSFFL